MPRQTAALHRLGNPQSDGKTLLGRRFSRGIPIAIKARSLPPVPSPAAPQRWPSLAGAKILAKPCLEKAAEIGSRRIIRQPASAGKHDRLRIKAEISGGHLKMGAQAGRGIPAEGGKTLAVFFATVHLLFDLIKLYLWRWLLFFVKSFNLKSH